MKMEEACKQKCKHASFDIMASTKTWINVEISMQVYKKQSSCITKMQETVLKYSYAKN